MVKIDIVLNLDVGKYLKNNLSSEYSLNPFDDIKQSGAAKVIKGALKAASKKQFKKLQKQLII